VTAATGGEACWATTPLRRDLAGMIAAAVAAIAPAQLVQDRLSLGPADETLRCDGQPVRVAGGGRLALKNVGRIVVVGGGKAAAGFAAGLESLLGTTRLRRHGLTGLISVPAGCSLPLQRIEVRETRPPAVNLPTPEVVAATAEMLELLGGLGPDDLAIVLITGGGSALLEAPPAGVSLELIVRVTSQLAAAGADIEELNRVRQAISRVKGGGLATVCTAGRLLALVLSDVIGDDLATIASGPCLPPAGGDSLAAVLEHRGIPAADREAIARAARGGTAAAAATPATEAGRWITSSGCRVGHLLLGSNATAVTAAASAVKACGYAVVSATTATAAESANETGRRLAGLGRDLLAATRRDGRPRACIEGGEATVVVPADHGSGGRNQQTVLAAVREILDATGDWPAGLLVASFGTDGEDGPTRAAGAFSDRQVAEIVGRQPAALSRAIDRCDANPLLATAAGLIETGPTGSNVADLRIMLARNPDDNS